MVPVPSIRSECSDTLSSKGCRLQPVGFPWLRSTLRPAQQHTLPPPGCLAGWRPGGMKAAGAGFLSTHKDSLGTSLWGALPLPPTLFSEPSPCTLSSTAAAENSSCFPCTLLPPKALPWERPQGEISPREYQSIGMGSDSPSEQNTETASLLCLPQQHCTLTAASGRGCPAAMDLSRELDLQVSGSLCSPRWEVCKGSVCRGVLGAGRKKSGGLEGRQRCLQQPCCGCSL